LAQVGGIALGLAAVAAATAGPARPAGWTQPNGNARGTRATVVTPISSRTVRDLRVRWRFRLPAGSPYGSFASTPLLVGGTVYLQTLSSSVFALDARTGRVRWRWLTRAPNDGPNGLAATATRIFGATDTSVFALDRKTGRRVWAHRIENRYEQFVDIAPLAADGLVFVSTVGFAPGGRGALYALDQRTGRIRWRFQTVKKPWPDPSVGGGGAWYTPSLGSDGRLYVGVGNPDPWGGTKLRPNGGAFPGLALYTDALLALNARTGKLLWYDQVTPHDVRDYDFEASPIIVGASVYGAGKGGRVVAWNRRTGKRLWTRAVGSHLHDLGPLPSRPTTVCPGLWGGVLTPMAYAAGRLFVPVVEQCTRESAVTSATLPNLRRGDGVVTALSARTGRKLWRRRLGSPATGCATVAGDVVFAPTLDGRLYGLSTRSGSVLWRTQLRAGINGCPAVAGNLLVVGAGAPLPGQTTREVIAYGVGEGG
jgi:alcohol dehydrogenase (cytochrome c)